MHQAVYQSLVTGEFSNRRWQILVSHDSLLMGNSCLWGGLNCGTCQFPHPPGNLSPVIYCYRTSDVWQVRSWENITYTTSTVDSTFTRRIWGRVENLWWMATGRSWLWRWRSSFMPLTIQTTTTACSSDKLFDTVLMVNSVLKAFLSCTWESVCGTWSGSSSVSGCASTLVNLQQQQLADRAWWIYGWINPRPIVNRVFNQVLSDHPDLRHAVNAQVSILCQSFKWFVLKNGDHG